MENKTITKAELVEKVADATGLKRKDVKTVVDEFLDQVSVMMEEHYKVQLTGFGSFEVRERKARVGVRPGTTDKIEIPASQYPAFKPGKSLKEKVGS
jgi:DNA-binding protein HU-beta